MGYGLGQKGYRCFDPISKKLYVSRHFVLLKHITFFSIPASLHYLTTSYVIKIDPFDFDDITPTPVPTLKLVLAPIRNTLPEVVFVDSRTTPAHHLLKLWFFYHLFNLVISISLLNYHILFITLILVHLLIAFIHRLHEPSSSRLVVCDPLWHNAMVEELTTLHQTYTWDLVPLPIGKCPIGSRWVYKIKTKLDGLVERYKARLVAKGNTQEYDMDYEETFSHVAKMTIVRTLIVYLLFFNVIFFKLM